MAERSNALISREMNLVRKVVSSMPDPPQRKLGNKKGKKKIVEEKPRQQQTLILFFHFIHSRVYFCALWRSYRD